MRSLFQELRVYSSGNRRRPTLKYEPNLVKVPHAVRSTFELSHCDAETTAFLQSASQFSLWKLLVCDWLCWFVSRTTANGLLGRGGMFVLSTEQTRSLLRPVEDAPGRSIDRKNGGENDEEEERRVDVGSPNTETSTQCPLPFSKKPAVPGVQTDGERQLRFGTLLDIGAGDGGVTARMAPLFDKVYVTEYSATMRYRLRQRGYEVLDHNTPFHNPTTRETRVFDVISCLNVLDRADTPLTLLREMRDSLKPESGLLLLAVVLPWCPFVEHNSRQRRPRELLPMVGGQCCKGASFEASLTKLVENVLEPVGFELVRWTKLPYLCEGNLRLEYALLHDALLVLRRKSLDEFVDTAALAPESDYN